MGSERMLLLLLLLTAQSDAVVVDAPAPAPAPAVDAPPTTTETTEEEKQARRLRVVVQDVVVEGAPRLQRIFTASLVAEVRKHAGVSVVGMDEVRALVEQSANRQLAGCSDEACMSELADALGADIVISAQLSRLDHDSLVSLRRLDPGTAKVTGVDRRLPRGDGSEFLAVIGPAVEELMPGLALRDGHTRGVDREAALHLNPPPLPPWLFWTAAATTTTTLLAGAGAGAVSSVFQTSAQERVDGSAANVVAGVDVKRDFDNAQQAALLANTLFITGGALAVTTTTLWFFTDFSGRGDEQ